MGFLMKGEGGKRRDGCEEEEGTEMKEALGDRDALGQGENRKGLKPPSAHLQRGQLDSCLVNAHTQGQ